MQYKILMSDILHMGIGHSSLFSTDDVPVRGNGDKDRKTQKIINRCKTRFCCKYCYWFLILLAL